MTSTLTRVATPARFLPAYQPVEAYRGDDLDMPWTFSRWTNNVRTLVPVNTWVFTAQLRYEPDAEPALADFTIDSAQAASGLIIVSLAKAVMQGLPVQRLWWDLQRVLDNKTKTLIAGPFTVTGDFTRP